MKVFRILFGLMLCLTLTSSFSQPLLALSSRPDFYQHDEQGNFVRDPFSEADALRYGGLFGPLPEPEWKDEIMIPKELQDPNAFNFYDEDDYIYYYNKAIWNSRKNISVRDMGFSVDENHYIPITRVRSS